METQRRTLVQEKRFGYLFTRRSPSLSSVEKVVSRSRGMCIEGTLPSVGRVLALFEIDEVSAFFTALTATTLSDMKVDLACFEKPQLL
mmetsp:Transcript_27659/g.51876  ORF Transcript_27659/g.51876 Transcript_27659/m.51876 type:complete len:88 (+) Transcript_27659:296-559(+)